MKTKDKLILLDALETLERNLNSALEKVEVSRKSITIDGEQCFWEGCEHPAATTKEDNLSHHHFVCENHKNTPIIWQ